MFDSQSLMVACDFCELSCETNPGPVCFFRGMAGENFCQGVVAGRGQHPTEALGEAGRLSVVEPAENAVAEESSRTKQRLVDVVGAAVDRADDLEAEEIGEHPVGEVED